MNNDDGWAREVVRTVEEMSRRLVEFRQDVNRAMQPLYPRIVEIEKRADREAEERTKRQKELDGKLAEQNRIASQQGAAIQQALGALNAHSEILQSQSHDLAHIRTWQRRRAVIEIVLIAAAWAVGRYYGVF